MWCALLVVLSEANLSPSFLLKLSLGILIPVNVIRVAQKLFIPSH